MTRRPRSAPAALLGAALALAACDADPALDPDAAPPDAAPAADSSCGPPSPGITWVPVPAGELAMGCSPGDAECAAAESPVHAVSVPEFELTATEITQAQYRDVTGLEPSHYPGCDDCPVDSVTWPLARAFCEAQGGRLPTEAEWERAARAGATTRHACGDDAACLAETAWYLDNSGGAPHPAATRAPNAWCLHDLAGNVWEWVEDCWHDTYAGAPADGSAWVEAGCPYRVLRGGSFGLDARGLRVSNRGGDFPDIYFVSAPGFRCARSAP